MEHTTCLFLVTFLGKPTCYYLIPAMPKGVNLPGNLRPPTFAKCALEEDIDIHKFCEFKHSEIKSQASPTWKN